MEGCPSELRATRVAEILEYWVRIHEDGSFGMGGLHGDDFAWRWVVSM